MGTPDTVHVPFLKTQRGSLRWIIAIILAAAGLAMFPFAHEITTFLKLSLSPQEQTLLVSVYPASISFTLMIVGSINPLFFRYNVVRIPVIFDVVLFSGVTEENLVTFDLSASGCFLRTFEPIAEGTTTMIFESKSFKSPSVTIDVVWENHQQKQINDPTGSIVRIVDPPSSFYIFLLRYHLFRLWKGVVFNLRLPGFQAVRLLFMRPVTIMLTEVVYKAGSIVFRQGDSVDTFYYIKKGKVKFYKELESGERITIETMEAGQIFNEMVLLGKSQRNVTVECQTLCVLAQSKADNLDALIRNNPDFASALVRKLATRADQTQNNLTQTIDYLQKIIQIKDSRTRNAIALLALGIGNKIQDSKIGIGINTASVEKQTGLKADEIIHFIHHSLVPDEIDHDAISQKISDKIGKLCRGISVDLTIKK